MEITRVLCPPEKWNIKCPYEMTPTGIVVHNTANDASAMAEISYMIRNDNYTSYHYGVDDYRAVQGILETRNSWNAGDGTNGVGNRERIAVEICYSLSGGDSFTKAEDNAVILVVSILKRYGWGIKQVTKHQDYSGKYCPHRTLDLGWNRFLAKIEKALNPPVVPPTPNPVEIKVEDISNRLVKLNKDASLWDLNFKVWSEAKTIKSYPIGTELMISATAKHPLGGVYYLTEYSYSKGIMNGFNIKDCDELPPVVVIPPTEPPVVPPVIPPIVTPPEPVEPPVIVEPPIIPPIEIKPPEVPEKPNLAYLLMLLIKRILEIIKSKFTKG
jgi:hypothetical protein